jgi:hypothetical protein
MMREFQLVLQFKPWGDRPPDDLVAVEERLEALADFDADVDGHDFGSGEGNIFIITSDPHRTLRECMPAITAQGLLPFLSAGYRQLEGDSYVRLWPIGIAAPFEVV